MIFKSTFLRLMAARRSAWLGAVATLAAASLIAWPGSASASVSPATTYDGCWNFTASGVHSTGCVDWTSFNTVKFTDVTLYYDVCQGRGPRWRAVITDGLGTTYTPYENGICGTTVTWSSLTWDNTRATMYSLQIEAQACESPGGCTTPGYSRVFTNPYA